MTWQPPTSEGWIEGDESDRYMFAEEAINESRNIQMIQCWDSRTGKHTMWWRPTDTDRD